LLPALPRLHQNTADRPRPPRGLTSVFQGKQSEAAVETSVSPRPHRPISPVKGADKRVPRQAKRSRRGNLCQSATTQTDLAREGGLTSVSQGKQSEAAVETSVSPRPHRPISPVKGADKRV